MLKSWLISFLILMALALAVYLGVFDWLASGGAKIVGIISVLATLIAAWIVLGKPRVK